MLLFDKIEFEAELKDTPFLHKPAELFCFIIRLLIFTLSTDMLITVFRPFQMVGLVLELEVSIIDLFTTIDSLYALESVILTSQSSLLISTRFIPPWTVVELQPEEHTVIMQIVRVV